jgi:hypothetical protein
VTPASRELVGVTAALVIGRCVRHGSWPVSGHLTMALTVPWLAGADRHAPAWWRAKVWLPAGCFLLVGTF